MKKYSVICLLLLFACTFTANAQEPIDWNMVSKIKAEGFKNSQVMETMFYLTDVHGPCLSNSPNKLHRPESWRARGNNCL